MKVVRVISKTASDMVVFGDPRSLFTPIIEIVANSGGRNSCVDDDQLYAYIFGLVRPSQAILHTFALGGIIGVNKYQNTVRLVDAINL